MSIGAPVVIGSGVVATGNTSQTITTTADAPAGTTIIVFLGPGIHSSPAHTVSAVGPDSAGNTYTIAALTNSVASSATDPIYVAYTDAQNTVDLPIGGTIPITYSTSGNPKQAIACSVSGLALTTTLDLAGFNPGGGAVFHTASTTTSWSMAGAALSQAIELLFVCAIIETGNSDSYTEDGGYTVLASAGSTNVLRVAYAITASTPAKSWNPTIGTARAGDAAQVSFLPPAPPADTLMPRSVM